MHILLVNVSGLQRCGPGPGPGFYSHSRPAFVSGDLAGRSPGPSQTSLINFLGRAAREEVALCEVAGR